MNDNDPLNDLLVRQGRPMDDNLVAHLRRSLDSTIQDWLSNEIEGGNWLAEDYPYFGPNTCYLMATAAIVVLEAIYDAETDLIEEDFLDAGAAILPEKG